MRIPTPILPADAFADASPWRAVGLVVALFVLGFAWVLVRSRLAPRTIRAWSGRGACPHLSPAHAAVLVRLHPSRILAAVVADLLSRGRARLVGVLPLRVDWPDRAPEGPVVEALDRAVAVDGRIDPERALDVLEALHAELEEILAPWSGRLTALACRERARAALDRTRRSETLAEEDVPWLLLADPGRVLDAGLTEPAGRAARAVVRFGGAFRREAFPAELLRRRVDRASSGFFAFRRDLLAGRGDRTPGGPAAEPRPTGPGSRALLEVAEALGGRAIASPPVWPLAGPNFGAVAIGRLDGRPASALFGEGGELDLELRSEGVGRFALVPDAESVEIGARVVDLVGDARLASALDALRPFEEIRGFGDRVRARLPFDRETIRAADVLARLGALAALAEGLGGR